MPTVAEPSLLRSPAGATQPQSALSPQQKAEVMQYAYRDPPQFPQQTDTPSLFGAVIAVNSSTIAVFLPGRGSVEVLTKAKSEAAALTNPGWISDFQAYLTRTPDLESIQPCLHPWFSPGPHRVFAVRAEVEDFVKRYNLENEFDQVKNQLVKVFNNPQQVTVELFACPEDAVEDGESLVFTIKCDMDRQAFRRATECFFAPFRSSGSRLYPLVAVLREV